ncbi:hypothetical protein FRC08_000393 [Ceratobasidium sp. 394]|nr:hypothetical protein FRC08_000393 [Ceratobasidium sp. 394]
MNEANCQDPPGGMVPEEIEAGGQIDAESAEDGAEGVQNLSQGRPAAERPRSKPGKTPKSKRHAKPDRLEALDVDVARFIATEWCCT